MKSIKAGLWFVRMSWAYLGCNRGSGRWSARAKYLRGIVPKTAWFMWRDIQDRKALRNGITWQD